MPIRTHPTDLNNLGQCYFFLKSIKLYPNRLQISCIVQAFHYGLLLIGASADSVY